MPKAEMRAVASFGDDPEKIVVLLPAGDPKVMLAEVATKPNFQLFGTAFSYSYPDEELAKRPAHPANTLIEMGVPYCFHVPDNAMFELKQDGAVSHLVFRKVWTTRAAGSSVADYRSPTHVLYHNKTTVRTPNFPPEPDLGTGADLYGRQRGGGKGQIRPLSLQPRMDVPRHGLHSRDIELRGRGRIGTVGYDRARRRRHQSFRRYLQGGHQGDACSTARKRARARHLFSRAQYRLSRCVLRAWDRRRSDEPFGNRIERNFADERDWRGHRYVGSAVPGRRRVTQQQFLHTRRRECIPGA